MQSMAAAEASSATATGAFAAANERGSGSVGLFVKLQFNMANNLLSSAKKSLAHATAVSYVSYASSAKKSSAHAADVSYVSYASNILREVLHCVF
ncbi:hypothetical protein EJB05_00939 [Eragrostis curvula]|uniref:Uncharacterized protein n=1 Tax=Eragrostis curvula TaxID=38414 RepID=A0A5J9WNE0_9POAL|nr:hypothetical protein EJB05_23672 [Eragrostis curvula]TVU49154.1 hypothetical protein EJB05_00448 [Eragrostis curvula]TVU49621.1 hypothetical protein EJB05_00939 [Eragrostis curvula]